MSFSISTAVWTVVNLLILFFIAKKFLFGRIDNVIRQRQTEIEEATKEAEKARAEAEDIKKEYEKKISLADEEKEQILADIKKQGYEEYERIVSDAKKKGDKIIVEAKHNAEVEADRAKEVYAAQLTDMVIDAASKIAASKHSTEDDRELYDKFINEAGEGNEQES